MRPTRTHARRAALLFVVALFGLGCVTVRRPEHADHATSAASRAFLSRLVRPWPDAQSETALAVSNERSSRVSSYDNALMVLYLLRTGRREQAERILRALAELQRPDGAVPFSFAWPAPDRDALYVRAGAAAWVGYAATAYLESESSGSERAGAARLAHGIANYLLQHQISDANDDRDGLVLGGEGSFRLEVRAAQVRELYVPGPVQWASTEHNIDAFFFLRDFGRITGHERFSRAAERIRSALSSRAWMAAAGQLARGLEASSIDGAFALDCASWGALFLSATKDTLRAQTALAVAEWRYGARDRRSGALGHRPYAHAALIENRAVAARLDPELSARSWDTLAAVWPEGSAGVALAALRLGRRGRAQQILAQLELLRDESGGLPDFTFAIPFEFEALPSLAGTVWVELVRYELARPQAQPTLWAPD